MATFTADDLDVLSGLHVQRAWFAHSFLPAGERRLHTGMGPKTIGGFTWEGISDPFGGQLVAISSVEEPQFGQAVAIDIVMSGANKTFLKTMWDGRHTIEGAQCDLYFAVFDAETGAVLITLKKMFPGKFTSPRFNFVGSAIRAIFPKVVSIWEGMNFPSTKYMWSPAGQRERYPGDKGLDFINSEVIEEYKA